MVRFRQLQAVALSFPEASEQSHFEKTSFRVGKKIFATYDSVHNRCCLKLPETDQDVFCCFDRSVLYPVPNKWGTQGWTFIELSTVRKEMLDDALAIAYCIVAPKKLAALVRKPG
jgi:predicted DNA-binding protein (MmcQ/YjbR family)